MLGSLILLPARAANQQHEAASRRGPCGHGSVYPMNHAQILIEAPADWNYQDARIA
jgi:hypothetical protein